MAAIAETMEKAVEKDKVAAGPSREQLESAVKAFHNFITAVSSGTFAGAQSPHINALLGLLRAEHENAIAQFEAAYKQHPEWGNPPGNRPA